MSKKFKVVRIINKYYVAVNAGHGDVAKGDALEIYAPGNVEIFDPDTNESLGMLDYIKAEIEVEDVFEKMCVCKSAEFTQQRQHSIFQAVGLSALNEATTKTVTKELNVSEDDISGGFANIDKKIKVGDMVRKPLG